MNRTSVVVVVIAVAALLAVGNAQTANPPQEPTGRYQLVSLQHQVVSTTIRTEQDVLRIDTATGETSVWRTALGNGTLVSKWEPIK